MFLYQYSSLAGIYPKSCRKNASPLNIILSGVAMPIIAGEWPLSDKIFKIMPAISFPLLL